MRTGLPEVEADCIAATNLPGSQAATRGSFQPPTPITAGYLTPFCTWATPSISYKALHSVSSFTVPNSGVFTGPFGENSIRMAFAHPTLQIAARNKSGRSVIARLIKMPPALVPVPASFSGLVYPFFTRYSAHEIKSFQVFGLVAL